MLWVSNAQLVANALVAALVLLAWFGVGRRIGAIGFYLLFAIAVTASVQLVGVYLVFASLIIPALAVRRHRRPIPVGYALGVLSYALGLVISVLADLPSGPVIVWSLVALALPVAAFGQA